MNILQNQIYLLVLVLLLQTIRFVNSKKKDKDDPNKDEEYILVRDDTYKSKNDLSKQKLGKPLSDDDLKNLKKKKKKKHSKVFNKNYFEGDIMGVKLKKKSSLKNRALTKNKFAKWPKGIVPYAISEKFDPEERAAIQAAMNEYKTKSCIRWTPKKDSDKHFVLIVKNPGCGSQVGRSEEGHQEMSLGDGCIFAGVIIHEMLHVLGFIHEQSRPDRDDHVKIIYENIQKGKESNFRKIAGNEVNTLGLPYDLTSIMHYNARELSKNDEYTIVPLKGSPDILKERDTFSELDLEKLNTFYGCKDFIKQKPKNKNKKKKKNKNKKRKKKET